MAHYRARGRLHFSDTREQAGECAVQDWARLLDGHDPRLVAIIADASNVEIDRLNARARHLRQQRGELGPSEIELPSRHYGLREGDLITLTATHKRPGTARVENGARGEITTIDHWQQSITVLLDGSNRHIRLEGQDLEHVRLAYAQHVYRQQGATVDRAVIVTGGWQTSRESVYVQASRARYGSDWYIGREELDTHGHDERLIEQLAAKMRTSRTHRPSLEHRELPGPEWDPGRERTLDPWRRLLPGLKRETRRHVDRDRTPDLGR